MQTAIEAEVYTYRRYGSNGGTSIYHSQDKISAFDDQLKITNDLGRSKAKKRPTLWLNQIDSKTFRPTTGMYQTSNPRWFFGDQRRKRDFIMFEFREDREFLKIHLIKNFKPVSPKVFAEKFRRQ